MVLWLYCFMVLWLCGFMDLWLYSLWFSGFMVSKCCQTFISCFLIDTKFLYKIFEIFYGDLHNCPVPVFTKCVKKGGTWNSPTKTNCRIVQFQNCNFQHLFFNFQNFHMFIFQISQFKIAEFQIIKFRKFGT